MRQRLAESFETALHPCRRPRHRAGDGQRHRTPVLGALRLPGVQLRAAELEPRLFSFNNPMPAPARSATASAGHFFDPARVVAHPHCRWPPAPSAAGTGATSSTSSCWPASRPLRLRHRDTPFEALPEAHRESCSTARARRSPSATCPNPARQHQGARLRGHHPQPRAPLQAKPTRWPVREELAKYRATRPCPDCHGTRLRTRGAPRAGRRAQRCRGQPPAAGASARPSSTAGARPARAPRWPSASCARSPPPGFLIDVGLDYLSLDRSADTLSGGEAQRIRLASQIGSGLTGVMYVLDEPSIGLHQRDNDRLLGTLRACATSATR
jgi:excinuclease ABC subunit A